MRFMNLVKFSCVLFSTGLIAGCSGEKSVDKTIIGTWLQDTPVSMTSDGLQTTTADTVLRLKKDGVVHLTRNLDIAAQGLPEDGVKISIELRGRWEILDGQLKQTQDSALIMPRTPDDITSDWAEKLQAQANDSPPTIKDIVAVDKNQLILQDVDTGATDIYRRK